MDYFLNHKRISYQTAGDETEGPDTVLLHNDIDLTYGRQWAGAGYVVEQLYDNEAYQVFRHETATLLRALWKDAGLILNEAQPLDQYHRVAANQQEHLSAVEKTKWVAASLFPGGISRIEQRVTQICGTKVIARNPYDDQSAFHFRVVRPQAHDNNPLHRDVWLPDYANCINLYIPIAGSNADSSLSLIPGSHHWPENKVTRTTAGALVDGVQYNVPAVTAIKETYEVVRPDPKENEVLVFSPYLVHGGAANLTADQTRISIELRLWKSN